MLAPKTAPLSVIPPVLCESRASQPVPKSLARNLFEHPWAATTLALAATVQGSEVLRDVCLAQSTDICLEGHLPGYALAGAAACSAVPHLVKPVLVIARTRWEARGRSAAEKLMHTPRGTGERRLTDKPRHSAHGPDDLRQAVAHGIALAVEATEGLCGLIAQGCVAGASPVGRSVAGLLLALAAVTVGLTWHAGRDGAGAMAIDAVALSSCDEACSVNWNSDDDAAARAVCLARCTERLAATAARLRRQDAFKLWTSLAGHALGITPALVCLQAALFACSGATGERPTPLSLDAVEEWHSILHLAVWLPVAIHHISGSRRLLDKVRRNSGANG